MKTNQIFCSGDKISGPLNNMHYHLIYSVSYLHLVGSPCLELTLNRIVRYRAVHQREARLFQRMWTRYALDFLFFHFWRRLFLWWEPSFFSSASANPLLKKTKYQTKTPDHVHTFATSFLARSQFLRVRAADISLDWNRRKKNLTW